MASFGSSKKANDFLTTGQVAAHCGVNFRTVIRWIKKGILQAQRLPGRGDHRISRAQFLEFLEKNQLAVPEQFLSAGQEGERQSLSELGSLKVLIVDDDPITANAIQRVLKLKGYETRVAHGGFEAGMLIEGFRPALVTLDLLMHGVDGIAVLELLKSRDKLASTKVIVISGDSDAKMRRALEIGASKALKKPFDANELVSSIVELIGEARKP